MEMRDIIRDLDNYVAVFEAILDKTESILSEELGSNGRSLTLVLLLDMLPDKVKTTSDFRPSSFTPEQTQKFIVFCKEYLAILKNAVMINAGKTNKDASNVVSCRVSRPSNEELQVAFDANNRKVSTTARALGVKRPTLYRWLKEADICR